MLKFRVFHNTMSNIAHFKYLMVALLFICTTTLIFYVSSISQIETDQEHSSQLLVFREVFEKNKRQIVLTRMVDIERQRQLHQVCKKRRIDEYPLKVEEYLELLDHIIIDDTHKLLYCYVPKVACTNWKRVLMMLQGKTNLTNVVDISASLAHSQGMFMKLGNYSGAQIKNILQTYTKFIFVRHPFERLLSAYRNKLEMHYESSKYFQQRYGRYIVKKYRPHPSQDSLIRGDDVSFKEFASYVIDEKAASNEHWKPIHRLCQPCLIDYDIIGKYETLLDDADFVLRHIGQSNIQFPKFKKPSSTSSKLKDYFSTLPRNMMQRLYEIYALDFNLFQYNINEIFHPDPLS